MSAETFERRNAVSAVAPMYPAAAAAAGVEGIVIIEAIIGTDGAVKNAKILRSVPGLDQAALDAVQQWRFTPTLLNGKPVEIVDDRRRHVHREVSSGRSVAFLRSRAFGEVHLYS